MKQNWLQELQPDYCLASLRLLALISLLSLLGSGCASHRPAPTVKEISEKRAKAEALEGELAVLMRQLDKLEKTIASVPGSCPLEAQAEAIDRRIAIARKAKDAVVSEYEHMKSKYIDGSF